MDRRVDGGESRAGSDGYCNQGGFVTLIGNRSMLKDSVVHDELPLGRCYKEQLHWQQHKVDVPQRRS